MSDGYRDHAWRHDPGGSDPVRFHVPWVYLQPDSSDNDNIAAATNVNLIWDFFQSQSDEDLATISSDKTTVTLSAGSYLVTCEVGLDFNATVGDTFTGGTLYEARIELLRNATTYGIDDYWQHFDADDADASISSQRIVLRFTGFVTTAGGSDTFAVRIRHNFPFTPDVTGGAETHWGFARLSLAEGFDGFALATTP